MSEATTLPTEPQPLPKASIKLIYTPNDQIESVFVKNFANIFLEKTPFHVALYFIAITCFVMNICPLGPQCFYHQSFDECVTRLG